MKNTHIISLIILILLVFLAITGNITGILALSAVAAVLLFNSASESEEKFRDGPANQPELSMNIDTLKQQILRQKFNDTNNKTDKTEKPEFDNADIIDQIETGGNDPFQPIGEGVTTTSSADLASFNMHEPSQLEFMDQKYTIPLTNNLDVDERTARIGRNSMDKAKKSLDGAVRSQREMFDKYFASELNYEQQREWWDSSSGNIESDMNNTD